MGYSELLGALSRAREAGARVALNYWSHERTDPSASSPALDLAMEEQEAASRQLSAAWGEVQLLATRPVRTAAKAAIDAVARDFDVRFESFGRAREQAAPLIGQALRDSIRATDETREAFQVAARRELGVSDR